ncbi:MAG: Rha family transcriptional regulator [Clostridia bacterium]|nr:Rha family transcriptional regulator [Clostridia bacterium]
MKHMIPMDEYGMFASTSGVVMADSRFVAETFGRSHAHVLRAIQRILSPKSGVSQEFNRANFGLVEYIDAKGEKRPAYNMTRSGFAMLVFGFTGDKAMQFKELYIKLFDAMEEQLVELKVSRADYPRLTDAIKANKADAKAYHYSNEANLLNRIVLGMDAKQYRTTHNLPSGSIRPYLSADKLKMLDQLEVFDANLYYVYPEYKERERILRELYSKLKAEAERRKIAQITAGTEAV